jgi:hypothetical protein
VDSLPQAMAAKLEKLDMRSYYASIPRNLRALFNKAE